MTPTDAVFDAIDWEPADTSGEKLDDLLSGCLILGAETVTDGERDTGLLLYLQDKEGNYLALNAQAEIFGKSWDFCILKGNVMRD